jgi:translation initiation factor 1
MNDPNKRLVYSTDGSTPLPRPEKRKNAPPSPSKYPDDGVIRVAREKRRASIVTLVTGVAQSEIEELGKVLRKRCGTGGTTKNGTIEIQGDHRDAVVAFLTADGKRVKRAGG